MSGSLEELLSEIEGLEKEVEEELGKRGVGLEEAKEYRRHLRGRARVEYERVKGRLEILSERLEGIDGEKLRECREKLGKVVREIGEVDSEISRVSRELGYIERDIARRRELEREFSGLKPEVERIERDLRIINLVSKALYVDKVWPYIFESIGRPVVEVASERIEVLTSGKFRLDLKGNEIVVIDSSGLERSAALLSGGEKTLISLILALTIAESVGGGISLFFIDEGFAALDSVNREKVAEMVGKLEEHGKTVMFITHFEDLADKFENVIRMENGRIVG